MACGEAEMDLKFLFLLCNPLLLFWSPQLGPWGNRGSWPDQEKQE